MGTYRELNISERSHPWVFEQEWNSPNRFMGKETTRTQIFEYDSKRYPSQKRIIIESRRYKYVQKIVIWKGLKSNLQN